MPPRRRRAGYRPGQQLTQDLREAIAAEAEHLSAIDEPIAAIDAVGDLFIALDDALEAVAVPRLRAIARLRAEGWSYDRICDATKLSKARVAQLAREARDRGL